MAVIAVLRHVRVEAFNPKHADRKDKALMPRAILPLNDRITHAAIANKMAINANLLNFARLWLSVGALWAAMGSVMVVSS